MAHPPLTSSLRLQQFLPLAVLKLHSTEINGIHVVQVATVLTACGIETQFLLFELGLLHQKVATVLAVYGVETRYRFLLLSIL